ncbi:MAG: hypothetical protein N3C60_04710 [Calditerrivibrio sp.]|nr:hypothetical protein [Calditerrivibrio sp.]
MGKTILKDLELLCSQLGITLRYEKTSARGGLCRVDDKFYIIIDKKAKDDYKAFVIAKSLKQFDLSQIHLKPKIREFLEEY